MWLLKHEALIANSVFCAVEFPHGVPELNSTLTNVNRDYLPLKIKIKKFLANSNISSKNEIKLVVFLFNLYKIGPEKK